MYKAKMILTALFLLIFTSNTEAKTMNSKPSLSPREQQIASIAAFTAQGDINNLQQSLNNGLDNGLSINEIKEVLVQMYAYAGFPRSLNGIATFMQVLEDRKQKGIEDNLGQEGKPLPADTDKWAYGNNVQIELTGQEVKGGVMDFTPAINSFLKEHLFADIFGRGVLSYKDREIATISALSNLQGVDSQLQSHINIGKNTGLTDEQIKEITSLSKSQAAMLDTVFGQGEINPYNKFFTGTTYLNRLSPYDTTWNASMANVTFEPRARTNWHTHSGGQILLVLDGEGFYQEEGQPAQKLKKGDVVRIPIDVKHWHGAAPDSWFVHVSLETNGADNQVTWLEPVNDEQYKSATK